MAQAEQWEITVCRICRGRVDSLVPMHERWCDNRDGRRGVDYVIVGEVVKEPQEVPVHARLSPS